MTKREILLLRCKIRLGLADYADYPELAILGKITEEEVENDNALRGLMGGMVRYEKWKNNFTQ